LLQTHARIVLRSGRPLRDGYEPCFAAWVVPWPPPTPNPTRLQPGPPQVMPASTRGSEDGSERAEEVGRGSVAHVSTMTRGPSGGK